MKYYILTDLEGAAGVTNFAQWCVPGGARYDLARRLLTEELNACAQGIRDADPDAQIIGWDIKLNGNNAINIHYNPGVNAHNRRRVGLMR